MRNTIVPFLSRLFICGLFFYSTYNKLLDPAGLTATLAEKGMPLPEILTWVVILMELIFPIMILLGYKTHIAAIGLIIWLVPVTFVMHPFTDPKQLGNILKNFTIIGGLLMIARSGPGLWAIEPEKERLDKAL